MQNASEIESSEIEINRGRLTEEDCGRPTDRGRLTEEERQSHELRGKQHELPPTKSKLKQTPPNKIETQTN